MKKTFTSLIGIILLCVSTHAYAVTDTFTNPEDSYVSETSTTQNYGTETTLIADGVSQDPSTGTYGEVVALMQWDVSSIPNTATITGVSVTLNYSDASAAPYNFYAQNTGWSEGSVTWNDLDQGADILGSVPPFSFNTVTHALNADGIALVQGWVDGSIANNGLIIRSGGTNNGIVMDSKESGGTVPTLEITYTDDGSGPPTINQLLTRIEQLEALLAGVSRTENKIIFEGMNVQIVNGLGATNGNPTYSTETDLEKTEVNGLGNLIVGYNEESSINTFIQKTGSHNVVIGHGHNYSSFGGLVVGQDNQIFGAYSSVSGGWRNSAGSVWSSVSGGMLNTAGVTLTNSRAPSVSGGIENIAWGNYSSVMGGFQNEAYGNTSTINGGSLNRTYDYFSSVNGGYSNWAQGGHSSISGGSFNRTAGLRSHVSGGINNEANGEDTVVSGGWNNIAEGNYSTVSGGQNRTASGEFDWVAGSLFEDD